MNYKTNLRVKMWVSIYIMMLLAIALSLEAAEGEKAFEHETGFYYTVQKGDTLWDLSQKFSDSAWLWPEMWRENSQIANPHRIYPGERIRLFRRTGDQKIAEKKLGQPFPAKPSLDDLIHYNYTALDRVGFVRKTMVAPHGAIFKVQKTREMISMDDIVYIRPEGDAHMHIHQCVIVHQNIAVVIGGHQIQRLDVVAVLIGIVKQITIYVKAVRPAFVTVDSLNVIIPECAIPHRDVSPAAVLQVQAVLVSGPGRVD